LQGDFLADADHRPAAISWKLGQLNSGTGSAAAVAERIIDQHIRTRTKTPFNPDRHLSTQGELDLGVTWQFQAESDRANSSTCQLL
jgi:hypothetical protein